MERKKKLNLLSQGNKKNAKNNISIAFFFGENFNRLLFIPCLLCKGIGVGINFGQVNKVNQQPLMLKI